MPWHVSNFSTNGPCKRIVCDKQVSIPASLELPHDMQHLPSTRPHALASTLAGIWVCTVAYPGSRAFSTGLVQLPFIVCKLAMPARSDQDHVLSRKTSNFGELASLMSGIVVKD